ncbi:hypothetical protein CIK05_06820 [Bdellovibrio sp. qaytius]|nr:hypothetical protein CIK05_06820 [Bdellovibrio sp. qaytius]
MKSIIGSLVLLAGLTANAGLLTLAPGNKQIEGVTLNQTAQAAGTGSMSLLGAGLRSKTVLFVAAKVYVAEIFSSEAAKFSRDANALKSLETANATAIRLTFLRGVDAATVASSYREALAANNVNLQDAAIAQFLANVEKGGDAASGKSFVMLLTLTANGGTQLTYEDTKNQISVVQGPRALQQQILSIWLGNSADAGLEKLKKSLLNPVY